MYVKENDRERMLRIIKGDEDLAARWQSFCSVCPFYLQNDLGVCVDLQVPIVHDRIGRIPARSSCKLVCGYTHSTITMSRRSRRPNC